MNKKSQNGSSPPPPHSGQQNQATIVHHREIDWSNIPFGEPLQQTQVVECYEKDDYRDVEIPFASEDPDVTNDPGNSHNDEESSDHDPRISNPPQTKPDTRRQPVDNQGKGKQLVNVMEIIPSTRPVVVNVKQVRPTNEVFEPLDSQDGAPAKKRKVKQVTCPRCGKELKSDLRRHLERCRVTKSNDGYQ